MLNRVYFISVIYTVTCQLYDNIELSSCKAKNVTLSCESKNNSLSLKHFNWDTTPCGATQYNNCRRKVLQELEGICIGHNSCLLTSNILNVSDCRIPRQITIKYRCESPQWYVPDFTRERTTCATTMSNANCEHLIFTSHVMNTKEVSFHQENKCGDGAKNCAMTTVQKLCNNQRRCNHATFRSCLFDAFLEVAFECKDSGSSGSSNISDLLNPEISAPVVIDETSAMLPDTGHQITTTPSTSPVSISLDEDGRVVILDLSDQIKQTYTVCDIGWDDVDAAVVCTYLNATWLGRAKYVEKNSNFTTLPFSVNCVGNETTPFECSKRRLENGCNTEFVAGVLCCVGCKMSSDALTPKSYTVYAVAIAISVIALLSVVLIYIFVRRYNLFGKKTVRTKPQHPGDNSGQQSIALSDIQTPSEAKPLSSEPSDSYFTLDPKATGFDRTANGSVRNKPSMKIELPGYKSLSLDDVYDQTRENRPNDSESNVYSHCVDTVYDTSEHQRKSDRNEAAYDHFFGQKTENDYDLTERE